jgi:hypothetical protein
MSSLATSRSPSSAARRCVLSPRRVQAQGSARYDIHEDDNVCLSFPSCATNECQCQHRQASHCQRRRFRNGNELDPHVRKVLSGGNPQIAKADGDASVQAYIAAMPGWKRDVGRRLDALIMRNVPNVRKAVRWNSAFYGSPRRQGQGWFLLFHVLTRYVKVTFFSGTSLRPVPPGGAPKSKDARWLDIYEGDQLDEAQMATWVKQAAALPGWVP